MKRPNLFILGAPKCGTTALTNWLSRHPNIFVPYVKEPHYFCEEYRLTASLETYERLFLDADAGTHRYAVDASVWHLFSSTAVENILRYSPEARFVVMVRNPLTMVPSMHGHHRYNGNELIEDLSEAWQLRGARSAGQKIGVRDGYLQPQHLAYHESCALGWQLQRLFSQVARERVHVIVLEDIVVDANLVYTGVLDFLGLPEAHSFDLERVNAAKTRRAFWLDTLVLRLAALKQRLGITGRLGLLAWLRRWNTKGAVRPALTPRLQHEMAVAFRDDVALLGQLLGRDLTHWLTAELRDGA
ncbi:sulfotransferase [Thermomonas sp.]|uniref:sulfotransferase family protein n=1 Tax=Thermomonas sp. TaxID=1971895 RepID=UPI0026343F08|nr:sulfotransferase [Thermomonas sp.]MCO5054645.1 sulfotransferase [Thermomonas sp.]